MICNRSHHSTHTHTHTHTHTKPGYLPCVHGLIGDIRHLMDASTDIVIMVSNIDNNGDVVVSSFDGAIPLIMLMSRLSTCDR
jgi:hypothetical protein